MTLAMRRRTLLAVALAVTVVPEAAAQSGPDVGGRMLAAYQALASRLTGAAREHLVQDQQHWLSLREQACAGERDGGLECIRRRDELRLANLSALGEGPYPFVSEQGLIQRGTVGKISWSVDATWPRFDGTTADFVALNRGYETAARKAAREVVPSDATAGELRGEQEWPYIQSFALHRPADAAVTVAISSYAFSGGAHGYGGTGCSLVDLRTGRQSTLADVFEPGEAWQKTLVPLVRADLKKQFSDDRPGFDDAIEPASLAKTLRDPSLYCFQLHRLQLIFNPYAVGPYVSGTFEVNVPYATLRLLFARQGPLGRAR